MFHGYGHSGREAVKKKLEGKKTRFQAYKDRELEMLSVDGVKSYGVGSRNLQRYDTALKDIQNIIKQLENEIAELEAQLCGIKPRKVVGVVPRDW